MLDVEKERAAFAQRKAREIAESRERVALFLLCGVDLSAAQTAIGTERVSLLRRLRRLLERERQRGIRTHWTYDLNRHIALKQAFDRLLAAGPTTSQSLR